MTKPNEWKVDSDCQACNEPIRWTKLAELMERWEPGIPRAYRWYIGASCATSGTNTECYGDFLSKRFGLPDDAVGYFMSAVNLLPFRMSDSVVTTRSPGGVYVRIKRPESRISMNEVVMAAAIEELAWKYRHVHVSIMR